MPPKMPIIRPKSSEELLLEKDPLTVRETGFWIWKKIIVPPNAYVIHTRLGTKEPVTIGLGTSFKYNPYTDSYLVVPAAMQTIGVVANCITQEKQGINVLAYVQWQIDDFSIACRKLDLSDKNDPLGIVNAQLGEQAEAAIKDKIATMSVEEVLTDKAPIIEELTTRLKTVSEGRNKGGNISDEGLGIKIVTVQIREAIVSSEKLWKDLQTPFRHQQEKIAKMSYLGMKSEIEQKELEIRKITEQNQAETRVVLEKIKQTKETEALELKLSEETIRFTKEQESIQKKVKLEEQSLMSKNESEQRLKTQKAKIEQELSLEQEKREKDSRTQKKTMEIEEILHAIAEEVRLSEKKLEAERKRLSQEMELKKLESQYNLMIQEQENALKEKHLETHLNAQRKEKFTNLEIEEKTQNLKFAMTQKSIEMERLLQEIKNMVNEKDLFKTLIETLPELAEKMPQIHEFKVFQTGDKDPYFDNFLSIASKIVVFAQSIGISLTPDNKTSQG
ncbi:MAG: hypothetical protein HQK76_07660 [Desulfobacterales bacterium]|nr:hypothetical protein [Desulfobacterales bacterium]